MDVKALARARGEVIEKFINLEWVINAIISQHYFGAVRIYFVLEVLYDEYCSFGLRRRILEKIIPKIDRKQLDGLNRLNTIRNYFAHCANEMFEGPTIPANGQVGRVPDPRRADASVDFESLHNEFLEKEPAVAKYLFDVYTELGGVAS